jgi:TonB-linked SusC/RagA family outer membrane protein
MKLIHLLFILIGFSISQLCAQVQVSGTVTDAETGLALPGVSILIIGTSSGTLTDADGNYSIQGNIGNQLHFSFVGYEDQKITVQSETNVDIKLVPDVRELEEVVITSLGLKRERMALNYSVTQVPGKELTEAREKNLGDALAGKIAGVNVSNIATGPAGSSRIIIRGNVSLLKNNQPLYVIDGVLIRSMGFAQAGMWGGRDWGDGNTSINPDDIESISVLKGANASALYGSRAANGVILITTKKGNVDKGIGIEFNSNFVLESVIDYTDPQIQYGHGRRGKKPLGVMEGYNNTIHAWGNSLDGSPTFTFDGIERDYINTFQDGDNNIKKFYETGYTWTNSFAVNGGSEKQHARFSFAHLNNKGNVPNSGYKRLNLGLNYNGSYKKFSLNAKLFYTKEDTKNRPMVADITGNANYAVFMLPASIDVLTLKGDPAKPGAVYGQQTNPSGGKNIGDELSPNSLKWYANPYWAAYQFINDNTRNRIISQIQARYDFTDYLYAQFRFGLDWLSDRQTYLEPYGTSYDLDQPGNMRETEIKVQLYSYEWITSFRKIWNQFGINAIVGGYSEERYYENINIYTNEFIIPYFNSIMNAANKYYEYDYISEGTNSLFGSLELSWGGYLYLTATARNDWFSTLAPDRNSILYPSIGGSLVFSDLFSMPSWWNIGKIRASWAQVGGSTTPYNLELTYSLYGEGHLGAALGQIGGKPWATPNPNKKLVPLTSTETEVGLELGLFNNRIGLDVSLYDQETTDDIVPVYIPGSSGFNQTWINVGKIENRGYEILLTGSPVRGSFSWDIAFNFAENRTKVIRISDEMDKYRVDRARTRDTYIEHWEGEPYSAIVGYKQKMVDENPVIDSLSGYPVRNDALEILGYGVPPYTGGVTNTLSFKGWNLSFLIDFKFGGHIFSGTNHRMTEYGLHKQTLDGRSGGMMTSGVNINGEAINILVADSLLENYWEQYVLISDHFIYDASFVKLRQVILGYTFPELWLNKTPFKFIRLSFVGRNLALLYSKTENIDPESTYNNTNAQGLEYFGAPQTKSYGFNLLLRF